jgi:hypothetical protein
LRVEDYILDEGTKVCYSLAMAEISVTVSWVYEFLRARLSPAISAKARSSALALVSASAFSVTGSLLSLEAF